MCFEKRQNIAIPDAAKKIQYHIVRYLKELIAESRMSPSDTEFLEKYYKIVDLFEQFQKEVVNSSPYTVACFKGCYYCCYHWVEDVYSFEAQIIAHFIKTNFNHCVCDIVTQCRRDEKQLIRLRPIVEEKVAASQTSDLFDVEDVLLSSFYQLRRACPLLTEEKTCLVYPVRPLTCRAYVNLIDSKHCDPRLLYSIQVPTYLCEMEEEANLLLDQLHEKYKSCDMSGLRALLAHYLQ